MHIKIMQTYFVFMCKMQLSSQLGLFTDRHPQENPRVHSKVAQATILRCVRLCNSLQTPNNEHC